MFAHTGCQCCIVLEHMIELFAWNIVSIGIKLLFEIGDHFKICCCRFCFVKSLMLFS